MVQDQIGDGYHISVIPDTGCEVAPRCLECPLPLCKHDMPRRKQGLAPQQVRMQKVRSMLKKGGAVDQVMEAAKVSRRTGA